MHTYMYEGWLPRGEPGTEQAGRSDGPLPRQPQDGSQGAGAQGLPAGQDGVLRGHHPARVALRAEQARPHESGHRIDSKKQTNIKHYNK